MLVFFACPKALEPSISAQIMELHHSKHHQAYVTNLNNALGSYAEAVSAGDIAGQIALQAAIKFNGGGHINHSLFWQNLAPASSADANPDGAPTLMAGIAKTWGSFDNFKAAMAKSLLSLQGSGWGWLVKDTHGLRIVLTKDQDPVVGGEVPIFGIDMWEHAYYLQVSHVALQTSELRQHANPSFSTSTARQLTWRTSGRLSTGRLLRLASRAPERMPSRFSRHPCKARLVPLRYSQDVSVLVRLSFKRIPYVYLTRDTLRPL
jgi:Fe-Mn family superoxide dismutase